MDIIKFTNMICWLKVIVYVIFLTLPEQCSTLSICDESVKNSIDYSLVHKPDAVKVQYGKEFLAKHFGVSLQMSKKFLWNISSENIPHLHVQLSLCSLGISVVTDEHIEMACKVSLYSRIIGPEIITSTKRSSNYIRKPEVHHCTWDLSFPRLSVPGKYEVEVLIWWINDNQWIEGELSSRDNIGEIVHLGGSGTFYHRNIDEKLLPLLERLAVKSPNQGAIYVIENATLRYMPDMDTLENMGYDWRFGVHTIPDEIIRGLPRGEPITPAMGKEVPWQQGQWSAETVDSIAHAEDNVEVVYGNDGMMNHSMVSGFPMTLDVTADIISSRTGQFITAVPGWLRKKGGGFAVPLTTTTTKLDESDDLSPCIAGDNPGRWVLNSACDAFHQDNQGTPGVVPYAGSECAHSTAPIPDYGTQFRATSMVWRPYSCRLHHHSVCAAGDTKCLAATGLTAEDFDYKLGQFSSATTCLRHKNIKLIAGFGDSAGDEQWKNIAILLGQTEPIHYMNGAHDNGLVCKGGRAQQNIHKLDHAKELGHCVEASVEVMIRKLHSHRESVADSNITSAAPLTAVLVTNLMLMHSLYGLESLKMIKELLHRQGKMHELLAERFETDFNVTYRRIFMTGLAKHGFKRVGLTPQRMETANSLAVEILPTYGWEILNAYDITYPRPDGSSDGVTFDGGVSMALTDVLLSMLCNGGQTK